MFHKKLIANRYSLPQRQQAYSQLPPTLQRQQHARQLPNSDELWQPRTAVLVAERHMAAMSPMFATPFKFGGTLVQRYHFTYIFSQGIKQ